MNTTELKQLLESGLPNATVTVDGDGYHHDAVIISEQFAGQNTVQRQQLVYQVVGAAIRSGEVHAFSMQTYTPIEWEQKNG